MHGIAMAAALLLVLAPSAFPARLQQGIQLEVCFKVLWIIVVVKLRRVPHVPWRCVVSWGELVSLIHEVIVVVGLPASTKRRTCILRGTETTRRQHPHLKPQRGPMPNGHHPLPCM
jgi:hypothetical protein